MDPCTTLSLVIVVGFAAFLTKKELAVELQWGQEFQNFKKTVSSKTDSFRTYYHTNPDAIACLKAWEAFQYNRSPPSKMHGTAEYAVAFGAAFAVNLVRVLLPAALATLVVGGAFIAIGAVTGLVGLATAGVPIGLFAGLLAGFSYPNAKIQGAAAERMEQIRPLQKLLNHMASHPSDQPIS